nr:UdgX family uracil-DNA binding protein [Rubrivivax gelatinosus]
MPGSTGRPARGVQVSRVELAHEADFDGFRAAARRLLAAGTPPEAIAWSVAGGADADLFAAEPAPAPAWPDAPPLAAPAAFVALASDVVQHADPARFTLLYRLLWRLQREPALRRDPLDADRHRAAAMAQAVRREQHHMEAFVRFRGFTDADGQPWQAAWYEPAHHVVDAVAPFFARRFATLRWCLLTPRRSARWDGEQLSFGPGARREDAPGADAGEALWLTYYASTFNPARLNTRALDHHLPRRHRELLPEAALIPTLTAQAGARTQAMLACPPTTAARRLPAAARAPRPEFEPEAPVGQLLPTANGSAGMITPVPPASDRPARRIALEAQREAASACRDCALGALATQTVFGEGPLDAPLMLVGEQPGDQEDHQGRPFVGPSGQLLERALAALGWERSVAYVSNAVKHFKYELRGRRRMHKTPAQHEADACRHWLEAEIALVRPQAAIALGATAARQLLGRPVAVMQERGRWLRRDDGLPVLVTLHPAALLRGDPAERETAWAAWLDDLRAADPVARGGALP